ncbi:methyl-accepting chemotaxis protein [Simiduia sp. 21SJ11W-1]|uniref:methyl-accepting chemotaxis protein n=1 Tax=Simiduia sp. 21SJ11W-1 TaxID=2909669 RepID=UPI00209C85AE|nr:methyl-accepting chemotaxis protein [Simiduia sp. 21SJ11W-1]UTA47259.1 methyl-accepting chemotaxis protein [Simiduia sp. 21SJ11W-1]
MNIGLKQQLLISMAAALLLPLLVSTSIFNVSIRNLIDERLMGTELPASLREVRNGIELDLQSAIVTSRAVANNVYVQDFLAYDDAAKDRGVAVDNSGSQSAAAQAQVSVFDDSSAPVARELTAAEIADSRKAKQDRLVRYLQGVRSSSDAIAAYVVSERTGHYFNTDGLFKTLSPSADRDQWFYRFLASGRPYELSLDVDEASGKPTVFINYKIDTRGVQGVGGVGQSLAAMSELVRNYRLGKHGQVYLVDRSGNIKLHRDPGLSGRPLASVLQANGDGLVRAKDIATQTFTRDGEAYLAASIPLQSADWYLVAEIPQAELYAGLEATILHNLGLSLLLAVVFLVLVLWLANRIVRPLVEITLALEDITQRDGDLTARLPETRKDEVGDLARQVNVFIEQLHTLCAQIVQSSHAVAKASQSVNQYISQAAGRTEQQQLNTDMVATAVNEMGATVNEIARNAADAAEASRTAHQTAGDGKAKVEGTVKDMGQLNQVMGQSVERVEQLAKDIKSISGVLDVIKGISEQTNLLALNAAIEAARAGEQGRGFAVVADEVRTLAQRTAQSTEEINDMIARLDRSARATVESIMAGSEQTQTSVQHVRQTGELLLGITEGVNRISDMNYQIATATEEQSQATEEINRNVQSIADHSRSTGEDIVACQRLCQTLQAQSDTLADLMKRFTL